MTIKRKNKQKMYFVGGLLTTVVMSLFFYQYTTNTSLVNKNEMILMTKKEELSQLIEKNNGVKANISNLEKKLQEQKEKGINKDLVKKEIDSLLSTLEVLPLKTKSVEPYDNYSNLLKIVVEFPYTNDAVKNRANEFYAKKVLNLPSMKSFLKLYGDYTFEKNQISFLYYKEIKNLQESL